MSGFDIDRTLADWFEADALAPAPVDARKQALDSALRRRPRPAWLAGPGSHWGWETPSVRSRVAVPALIVVALLGVLLGGLMLSGVPLLEPPTLPTSRLGALAYAVDGDVFVADWDGSDPVRIADGLPGGTSGCGPAGFWAEGPMWSPDGRWLTYRGDQVRCDQPEADAVIVSDPEGNIVASMPGVGWNIRWSPDSSRLATWLDLYPSTKIGVYRPDGGREAVVSVPHGMSTSGDHDPVWSPDGQSLLVPLVRYHAETEQYSGAWAIWALPIDGGPPQEIAADDPRSNWQSRTSPDGRQLAYIDARKLFVAAADGSEPRDVVSGVDDVWAIPVWSPTGDRIAFTAGSGRLLRVVDVASGVVTTLATLRGDDELSIIGFSPEGDRILFSRHDLAWEGLSIWSVGLDGSQPQQLVSGTVAGDWQSVTADP